MTLIYLAIAWVVGILMARTWSPPWQLVLLTGLAGVVGWAGWEGSSRIRRVFPLLVACALGAGRLLLALPGPDPTALSNYNDMGPMILEGVVVGEPDEREAYTLLTVRADRLSLPDGGSIPVTGRVLVQLDPWPRFAYGDRLRIAGPLETPPEGEPFSYRDYLARRGIHSLIRRGRAVRLGSGEGSPIYAALLALKARARATIAGILHEPAASLLTGILLGIESGIPPDLMEAFSATGTTHIIAISGFNITIIAGIFAGLSRRLFGRRWATWVAVAGVVAYTVFVGASAAVVRAAIMGVIYLLGKHLGRETFAPASLAAAAVVMSAINPFVLWDVGFQLSFAATVGLLLYTGPLEDGAERLLCRLTTPEMAHQVVGWVSEALLVTMAAQITTTPLLLYHFHRLSLITLLTNFLILPAQPGVMIWGGLATLAGLVWPPAGRLLGWVAWLFLTYTIETVRLTARAPFAWIDLGPMEGWTMWAAYLLLAIATAFGRLPPERRQALCTRLGAVWAHLTRRWSDRLALSSSALLLALAVAAWHGLPDGRLHAAFLDAGGDAVLIRTPSGRDVLIGGGPSPSLLLDRLGRRMPFWDHTIDLVVLTHPDDDVLAGLIPVIERYDVERVIAPAVDCATRLCSQWEEAVLAAGSEVLRGQSGLRVWLDEGVLLSVLHPGPEPFGRPTDFNANSMVVRIDHGAVCLLLTGDADAAVEGWLVAQESWLNCDVLKAAHHGDRAATTEPFLEAVTPQVVVIPAWEGDPARQPDREVLGRLEGLQVLRTDRHGAVEIVSDGLTFEVRTGR